MDVNQPATLIFTSGTSGMPKAALHSFGNHYYSAQTSNRNIPVGPGDRWLLSLPMHHVAGTGIVFRCILGGGAVVIPEPGEPLEETIIRHSVTHLSLVSTQLYRMLQNPRSIEAISGLKAILLGGSAIPPVLIRRAFDLKLPILTSYGLTETSSQITATRLGDSLEALLTSGRPLTEDTVKIGPHRAIMVRGNAVFLGYYHQGKIEKPFDTDGWFVTKDLGQLDENGCIEVLGRRDNMFISGGENIQPEEIEKLLGAYPGIIETIVVPKPDAEFGSVPVAFLKTAPGVYLDEEALRAHLREHLPRYKVPKQYHPWPDHLDIPASKANRAALRDTLTQVT